MQEKIVLVKHKATGAMVPVVIKKIEKGVITNYKEYTHNRKGYRLAMLQDRWDMSREDVLSLLMQYEVPGYINHQHMIAGEEYTLPADAAIFWEEYVYAIEKKEKLKHSKLKSKLLERLTIN
jgi:hypothetical protein